jgi:CHAD domain-containing protein
MAKKSGSLALLDYLDERVEGLRKLAAKAIRDQDVEAVHAARVTTRRLKAAIDLMQPVLSRRCRRPFSRITRKLRRQLGPLRDLDVMLGHLADYRAGRHAAATEWVVARLARCRELAARDAQKKTPPAQVLARLGSWWGVRQDISDAAKSIDALLADRIHVQLDMFAAQAGQLSAVTDAGGVESEQKNNADSDAARAAKSPAHGDPHEVRIAGKSLRYTLEMAEQHGRKLPPRTLAQFKNMQEALGMWHDYIVLTERMLMETVECDLALHDPGLQEQILSLAQTTLRKAQVELKKFTALWSQNGAKLSEGIRERIPRKGHGEGKVEEAPVGEAAEPKAEAGPDAETVVNAEVVEALTSAEAAPGAAGITPDPADVSSVA